MWLTRRIRLPRSGTPLSRTVLSEPMSSSFDAIFLFLVLQTGIVDRDLALTSKRPFQHQHQYPAKGEVSSRAVEALEKAPQNLVWSAPLGLSLTWRGWGLSWKVAETSRRIGVGL